MKLLAIAILVLATTAAAQPVPAPQAPVNIAVSIYRSCLLGFTQARDWPKTLPEVHAQTELMDRNCTQWTRIWVPSFVSRPLTFQEEFRWQQRKNSLRSEYQTELALTVPKR